MPHVSIHEAFQEQARKTPEATAITFNDVSWTYAELDSRANAIAARLMKSARTGALVGLLSERSLEMVAGILGILKAGAAYVPIDPVCPVDRRQFMLCDSKVNMVLAQKAFRQALGGYEGPVLDLEDFDAFDGGALETRNLHADDAAYVIYTSGSTGRPKGVVVTHGNVLRLFAETSSWFQFGAHDVWTMFHSYAFDFSVWELWGALLMGGKLVIVPYWLSRSPEDFVELVLRENVTVLNQTPSAFRQFVSAEEKRGQRADFSLRYVIFGGEALEFPSLRLWMQRHGEDRPCLINMYGITETTVHVTYRPVCKAEVQQGVSSRIGVPIPDLRVYLLDDRMNGVPQGASGEMYVAGCGVARGYLNRPELTAERFVPDPFGRPGQRLYRTGDLGRLHHAGDLEYLGRCDHQVKVRGFRIELGEIESILAEQEDVRESAVLVEEDQYGDRFLTAYVAALNGISRKRLRRYLETRLPEYMVPSKIVVLERLPLTENGKLDRSKLLARRSSDAVLSVR